MPKNRVFRVIHLTKKIDLNHKYNRGVTLCWRSAETYFPAGINQGLAAALRVPPSGLFIALVIQIPAVTALANTAYTAYTV